MQNETEPTAAPAASDAQPHADVEGMPIEKCFDELETIVAALESQNTSLEDSLKLFERGMKLSARCSRELTRVERRIQTIVETARGELQAKDFKVEDDDRD